MRTSINHNVARFASPTAPARRRGHRPLDTLSRQHRSRDKPVVASLAPQVAVWHSRIQTGVRPLVAPDLVSLAFGPSPSRVWLRSPRADTAGVWPELLELPEQPVRLVGRVVRLPPLNHPEAVNQRNARCRSHQPTCRFGLPSRRHSRAVATKKGVFSIV